MSPSKLILVTAAQFTSRDDNVLSWDRLAPLFEIDSLWFGPCQMPWIELKFTEIGSFAPFTALAVTRQNTSSPFRNYRNCLNKIPIDLLCQPFGDLESRKRPELDKQGFAGKL